MTELRNFMCLNKRINRKMYNSSFDYDIQKFLPLISQGEKNGW